MSKARRLLDLFGGGRALARELGVTHAVVSRWDSDAVRGNRGNVPTHYNVALLEAARRLDLDLAAVHACLDEHECPCCKRPLEPGQVLDKRHLKTVLA